MMQRTVYLTNNRQIIKTRDLAYARKLMQQGYRRITKAAFKRNVEVVTA